MGLNNFITGKTRYSLKSTPACRKKAFFNNPEPGSLLIIGFDISYSYCPDTKPPSSSLNLIPDT
jgi:hypothetical protein